MNSVERLGLIRSIKAKLALGAKLTQREESYYLLFIANYVERCIYMNKKKAVHIKKE